MPALLAALAVLMSMLWFPPGGAWGASGTTTLVSVTNAGSQANRSSEQAAISSDGRYVAFESEAFDLVAGDTNGIEDIFVHDRVTGATSRVSVDSAGGQANGFSADAAISADGRYVVFRSEASDLVPGDTNGATDVFVHDRVTGATSRLSVDSAGGQANGGSIDPSLSADGRYVAFSSSASNLVPGDTNGGVDAFVHDRHTGATTRVSVDSAGDQVHPGGDAHLVPVISADGRYVAFSSPAADLVSGDGEHTVDVFVHDRVTATTSLVSVDSAGNPGNLDSGAATISADGRYVAFSSFASNLVAADTNGADDVFVHDRHTGATSRVSVDSGGNQATGNSDMPDISADGRYVAFQSFASTLVPGDFNGVLDVFVHDRSTGSTTRVSVASTGGEANGDSGWAAISADGRSVAFESVADNLVPDDTNFQYDVFVHQLPATPPSDTTPPLAPTVAVTDPVNAATQTAVTVSGTGEAGTTASISVDDEDAATTAVTATAAVSESGYSTTVDLSSLSDGILTATVTLADAAGNTSRRGTAEATKDTVAPPVPTVALPDPVTPRNHAAVTVSGTGEGGTTAHISVDDEDWATPAVAAAVPVTTTGYSATLDLSGLSNGTLTASVTLTDTAGNTGPAGTDTATKAGSPVDRGPGRGRP